MSLNQIKYINSLNKSELYRVLKDIYIKTGRPNKRTEKIVTFIYYNLKRKYGMEYQLKLYLKLKKINTKETWFV